MKLVQRVALLAAMSIGSISISGCTTALVVSYVHEQLTDGDPRSCIRLNSVERALSPRCGNFVPGSLLTKDVIASGLPQCPLALAARDARLWPVLPELLSHGAQPEACAMAPLVSLAQNDPCPDFTRASRASLAALRWLAIADARSIHHDAMRMLSCPDARAAGLADVLNEWLIEGLLPAAGLGFSAFDALHPDYLPSVFSRRLESEGHTARAALGAHQGRLEPGFEAALRGGHYPALDWWLHRLPGLANKVPPAQHGQLAWLPLAQVITPSFIPDVELRREMTIYLLAHGADPWQPLPHERGRTVLDLARRLHSPLVPLLEAPQQAIAAHNASSGEAPRQSALAATVTATTR